jgi:hypothetical protein
MKHLIFLTATAILLANNLFSQPFQAAIRPDNSIPIASFTTGTTYDIPNSSSTGAVRLVRIRMWAGGGAGSAVSGSNIGVQAGGGGSFLDFVISENLLTNMTNRRLTITVGQGGVVGTNRGRGGNTTISFVSNSVTYTLQAIGGNGGDAQTADGPGAGGVTPANPYTSVIQSADYVAGNGGNGNGGFNTAQTANDRFGGGGEAGKVGGTNGANGSVTGSGSSGTYSGGGTGFGKGGNGGSTANEGSNYGGGGSGGANGAGGVVYIYNYSQQALPVTLSSFTAKATTDNKVNLAWLTASEINNKGFRIERKAEGESKFNAIGFVASKADRGNSQLNLAYSFKDMNAPMGVNMYRLVQEDIDGKQTISDVRMVKLNGQSVVSVYPNPSNGAVTISRTNDGKKMNVQILDQSGRVINQYNNILDSNLRLNLPQSGIYQIKLMYPETGEQSIQRIVVQH